MSSVTPVGHHHGYVPRRDGEVGLTVLCRSSSGGAPPSSGPQALDSGLPPQGGSDAMNSRRPGFSTGSVSLSCQRRSSYSGPGAPVAHAHVLVITP